VAGQKTLTGRVVSDKMDKTVIVTVQSTKRHRLYHKILRRSKHYFAHDEGDAKPGDLVRIEETRPYSRHKRWRVAEILRRGEVAEIAPREIDSEYLSMQRQVEVPPPPPPRKEPEEELEETAEASDITTEAPVEEPEASAEAEEATEEPVSEATEAPAEADEATEEPVSEATEAPAEADEATEEPVSETADEDSSDDEENKA
jgi:small subunit ribosomal protein S17